MGFDLSSFVQTYWPDVFVQTYWPDVKEFANSVFFTAIVGSLAGAFAGAYGGQRIVERGKSREDLLKEMRNANAAIMVAVGICNLLLSVKKQHTQRLKEGFDTQKATLLDHKAKRESGQFGKDVVFNFQADLETLPPVMLPMQVLQTLIFEKLSLSGRPLVTISVLGSTVGALNGAIEKRNQLIETYKTGIPKLPTDLLHLYFGLPYGGGHINLDYPASIDAIDFHTNGGIFFSRLLCDDLAEYGEQIAARFKRKFGKGAPRINTTVFTEAEEANLMPNAEEYADWMTMFMKRSD